MCHRFDVSRADLRSYERFQHAVWVQLERPFWETAGEQSGAAWRAFLHTLDADTAAGEGDA